MMLQPYSKKKLTAKKNFNLLTWSGINNPTLLKHLQPSIATALVHLDQVKNNLQSTKPNIKIISSENPSWKLSKIDILSKHGQ